MIRFLLGAAVVVAAYTLGWDTVATALIAADNSARRGYQILETRMAEHRADLAARERKGAPSENVR
jgi:hypothetical protein